MLSNARKAHQVLVRLRIYAAEFFVDAAYMNQTFHPETSFACCCYFLSQGIMARSSLPTRSIW